MTTQHFDQRHLARRWNISPRTLERWRWLHQGPSYIRVGGRICYRLEDVEAYEANNLHEPAPRSEPRPVPYAGAER
jgi:hypothetical protein